MKIRRPLIRQWLRKPRPSENRETLLRFQYYPTLLKRYAGKQVHIYSNEHEAYWRPDGKGYTMQRDEAGVYAIEDAFARTKHCDPEKRIAFHLLSVAE